MSSEEMKDESPPPEGERTHSRIVIKPDGEVIIENLSMDLLELAEMLDPESAISCDLPDSGEPEPPDTDRDS